VRLWHVQCTLAGICGYLRLYRSGTSSLSCNSAPAKPFFCPVAGVTGDSEVSVDAIDRKPGMGYTEHLYPGDMLDGIGTCGDDEDAVAVDNHKHGAGLSHRKSWPRASTSITTGLFCRPVRVQVVLRPDLCPFPRLSADTTVRPRESHSSRSPHRELSWFSR
jgi:hypothetical protein